MNWFEVLVIMKAEGKRTIIRERDKISLEWNWTGNFNANDFKKMVYIRPMATRSHSQPLSQMVLMLFKHFFHFFCLRSTQY